MTLNNQRLLILFKFPLIFILLSCQFVEIEMRFTQVMRQATRIATEIGGVAKASKNIGGENLGGISHQFKHSGKLGKIVVAETGENAFLKTKHSFKNPSLHPEKHWNNNPIDFKRLLSHGTPSPTFLFSPKGKVFNYSPTGELFDKILTKKEKSKEMLKQIFEYILTMEDKEFEKLFKKFNKLRKNYNTVDPEIVKKINEILNDESILVEDKIEKISEILDEMNDNGEDFVEEEY
uniref:Lipoprotein n=1 Tax=Meloidogyne floridensis TaxID=298350 RepID=A0A915PDE8_9BILA